MGLSKKILNVCLAVVNALTFWVKPDPDQIAFISLTSDRLTSDFARLDRELKKNPRWKIKYDLVVFQPGPWGSFKYFLNCLYQVVLIKESALVLLNDNNYVVSWHKSENTKVVQVWHAAGAVKKFGNQIRRQYPIRHYDGIIACSPVWKKPYSQAFGVEEDQVHVTGMPRIDDLLETPDRLKEKYPRLAGKKVLLYAPTFRGNIIDGMRAVPFDAGAAADLLGPEWVIVTKMHPLLPRHNQAHERVLDLSGEDLYGLMQGSDVLVTDYSSILFDYSLLHKPMVSYVPDLEEYEQTIGLNVPYREVFPGPIVTNEQELANAVKNLTEKDRQRVCAFQNTYMPLTDGQNTVRTVKFLEELLDAERK